MLKLLFISTVIYCLYLKFFKFPDLPSSNLEEDIEPEFKKSKNNSSKIKDDNDFTDFEEIK